MTDQSRKYIIELFKVVSTDSILVVTQNREILRLYCPFEVICKVDVLPLAKGHIYSVKAVKMTLNLEEVFIIDNRAYFIWYFTIKS